MSKLNPFDIYRKYEKREYDKSSALYYLKSIVEHTEDVTLKLDGIEVMGVIKPETHEFFNFLEQVLISDENYQIRGLTAKVIIENYPKLAFEPIKWILEREESDLCVELIRNAIIKSADSNLKSLLDMVND
ncbi:MAG: hypothetical protein ACFFHV_07520 [Promethearchaeota archaeon]